MKTKEEIIKEGYPEDWATECIYCKSYDCHSYKDVTVCFSCKRRWENGRRV